MEHQKVEGMAKKIWNLVRVALYMIRKGICKKKLLLDLNIMMKRGKLAGKSFRNLMFHHHHRHQFSAADLQYAATAAANPDEYEFSCSNTPLYRPNLFSKRKPHHFDDEEEVNKVLELMVMSSNNDMAASPALPWLGSGRSPMTRQLRITDSPFPLQNDPNENRRVDQAAEDFINKFYSQLKRQQD